MTQKAITPRQLKYKQSITALKLRIMGLEEQNAILRERLARSEETGRQLLQGLCEFNGIPGPLDKATVPNVRDKG